MVTNRQSRLAVVAQALIVIAEAPRGMATSAEIADLLDVHAVVLRRLFAVLRGEGIVESRSGPKGGWAIASDPANIRLGRIAGILAGEPDPVTPAALDEALIRADEAYAASLDEVTLASLMDTRRR
jgi:DNA-binding IscR family transcriptional regulator